MDVYKVYVRVDESGRIVSINSSAFVRDTEGMVEIDHGPGDRFHHAQGNYLPGPLMDKRGIYRYKLADGEVVERTVSEMDADWAGPVPQEKTDIEKRIESIEKTVQSISKLIEKLGVK